MIKLFEPHISNEEIKSVTNVLKSKFWASGSGINNVKKFENEFCKYTKSKQCIAVNSGSAALQLALSLFNVRNKEVIVPSLTFVSSVSSVVHNGGQPIFVDINSSNLCIDLHDLEKKISKRTAAIIYVDFAGMTSNISKIRKIAQKNHIPVIEDAAHSAGATFNGEKIGKHHDAVCFSFHPVKNLAMPTGGAICLNGKNSINQTKLLHSLRWCGISDRVGYNYDVSSLGWNYYMNEISAAIGLVQLKKLDKINKIRKNIAKRYSKELDVEKKMSFSEDCSYHFYWIRVKNRNEFMKKMSKHGIETGIHYRPVHKMSYFQNGIKLPVTEKIGEEIVTIPTHPNLSKTNIDKIINTINRLYKKYCV